MRRLFFDVVAVLLTVAALSGVAAVDAVPQYVILRDECERSSLVQVTCDETVAKDDQSIMVHCSRQGLYLAYITSEEEFNAVSNVLSASGVSRAYVGARSTAIEDKTYWCWMADGWTFNNCSVFYVSGGANGPVAYSLNFWLENFPVLSDSKYVVFDQGSDAAGLRNVGGNDLSAYYVLCEKEKRSPPQFPGAPTIVEGETTTPAPTSSTSQSPSNTQSPSPTGTVTTSSPFSSEKTEFPIWVIGVIVDGVLLVLIIIGVGLYWCCVYKKKTAKKASRLRVIPDIDGNSSEGSRSLRVAA